jgi:hypothetical protein
MPTPSDPKDKRHAVSLAFGEWDLIVRALVETASACSSHITKDDTTPSTRTAFKFTRDSANRIVAKIRAEIPELPQ